jgi:hypothetical protein
VDWVCLAHARNSEHGAAISHYILQKNSSVFWALFSVSDFVSCNEVNLYIRFVISFYATLNGSNIGNILVVSEHNCHSCGAFTDQH